MPIWSSMLYAVKHCLQENKGICPRCGNNAFEHGFEPNEQYYCTKCGLWYDPKELFGNDFSTITLKEK